MANPDSKTVEVEFTPGVWTDVSQWVDWTAGGSTKFGRTGPFSPPSPGTFTCTLANDDGRFTPHRQVLADGVTVHPYWPNVLPRKRIRFAYVLAGVPYYRFTGYIKGWPTTMVNDSPRVVISATTRDDRLSRVAMTSPLRAEILADAPTLYWPLTDAVGSGSAAEQSGNSGVPLSVAQQGAGGPLTFGDNGPGIGEGTGVKLAPASTSNGQYLIAPGVYTTVVEFSILMASAPASPVCLIGQSSVSSVSGAQLWNEVGIDATGHVTLTDNSGALALASAASIADGNWHDVIAWHGSGINAATLTVDGVTVSGGAIPLAVTSPVLYVGQSALASGRASALPTCNIGQVVAHSVLLSATRMSAHFSALRGWSGETVDARIKRFLGYGGLTAADWNVDASSVVCSSYPQDGKDIPGACQDMAVTEGGGSVFYFGTDGKAQFRSRVFRKPAAPVLTLDNEGDLDGQTFAPAFDDTQIVNQEQGSRATASGTASTQTITDAASADQVTGYGLTNEPFTSYAQSDLDVLYNAQDRLAQQRQPAYRLGQVALDLVTAQTAGLYAAVASTDIGERIRISGLGPGQAPVTQVDVLVEGWADTFSANEWTVVFDTSPADNPARAVADDATYSSAQAQADCALSGALTAAVTTVVIASPTAPTFTLAAGAYPLRIQVGEEQIRLNTPPGGAVSPQTFTGVTRGVNGTTAAAQANGARVRLAPEVTASI